MNVLVTGANGFLGQHVVSEFCRRDHEVRALVRPSTRLDEVDWPASVDVFRADLRVAKNLVDAFDGIDVLVHLAACVAGDDETRFRSTVVGTENLLTAMTQSETRRLLLASSIAVYDWRKIGAVLVEDSTLETQSLHDRDGYAVAKVWQERVVRSYSHQQRWDLTVMRPGVIWGRGGGHPPNIGVQIGRVYVVIGPLADLLLTYVENCAHAFVCAAESPAAIGQTFNVVDGTKVTGWRFSGEYLRRSGKSGARIIVPYWLGLMVVWFADVARRLIFRGRGRLPSILVPCRFEARFRPVDCGNQRLREILNWKPPYRFEEALERTFDYRLGKPATSSSEVPRIASEAGHV